MPGLEPGHLVLLLPTTDHLVYCWTLGLMLAFVIVREIMLRHRRSVDLQDLVIAQDAVVFAGSVIMLMAVIEPSVLRAVADFRMPLLTLGFAGLRCSCRCILRA